MSSTKTLYLLDGMALVYRAHFAFMTRPILTSKGLNTSAVFGFANTLLDILQNRAPTHIAVAFDTPEPTERHEIYPEYKAQREAMPEELAAAIPLVKQLALAMNIPVLEYPGYEADDVIGTLARQAEKDGFETYMVTPDKDYAQLVDEHTFMMKPGRKGSEVEILGVAEILDQWGIERTEQVIDVLGLMGDASDNIPGVPGVGPKTAQKLVAAYGSVDGVLENVEQLKGKQKERLQENAELARLSRQLVTINCAVPVSHGLTDLERSKPNDEALQELLVELEFNAIGKRIYGDAFQAGRGQAPVAAQGDLFSEGAAMISAKQDNIENVDHSYKGVSDFSELPAILKSIQAAGTFCFDLETDSLDVLNANTIGVALSCKAHEGWFVYGEGCLNALTELWSDPGLLKIGQNLKYDLGVMRAQGLDVQGPFFDTMIAHALVEPGQRHNMDYMAQAYLNYSPISIETLIGPKGKSQKSMADIPVEEMIDYAAEDADITFQLYAKLNERLRETGQEKVFTEIEMPVLPVLTAMELEGIRVDTGVLSTFSVELGGMLDRYKSRVIELAGEEFNLNSPKQLGVVLFEKLKLVEKPKKTKTGQYSTNEQTLSALAPKHEIVRTLLDYREAGKLKSTYVDSLPNEVHPKTGRIHTSYLQTGAATGRLSSNNPNLQNIPIRTDLGKEIRKAFVPRGEGYTLMAADYSQIELRVMAHMSGDLSMQHAFELGQDIHTATAAKVFGVPLDEVTSEMRRKSKMVNFGIIYGISAFGLSQRLDIPRAEASDIIKQYFKQYPFVKAWMDQTVEGCKEKGYVETPVGRRRYLRDIDSRNGTVRQAAERVAINTPVQGAAADMIKLAMVNVARMLAEGGYQTKLLLQVHDELVFDLLEEEADELMPKIKSLMESAMTLDVPVLVEMGTGNNWLEAH